VGTLAQGEPLTLIATEADDAVQGESQAPVTVVAFLDFQCRFCAEGFSTLQALRAKYSAKKLRIVFKHLPLESHEYAVPAAVVGQVVALHAGSDAFYQFAKQVFTQQSDISFETLAKWAESAGVSPQEYNRRVSQPVTLERIIQDVTAAHRLGIESTPTFFINGRLLEGAQPQEVFEQMIDQELTLMSDAPGPWASRYQARVAENMRSSLVKTLLGQDPGNYRVPVDGSPSTGPATAPVTLVVFSDYECPFCKRAELTLQQVRQTYGQKVRIIFKHLPLGFHESARPAALLASALAIKSGDEAFFSLSRALFEQSPQLGPAVLEKLGKQHGLTAHEVKAALSGEDAGANRRVERDSFLADDVAAQGTPHFFINGKRLEGARPYEHFAALIDYELEHTQELLARGIQPQDLYAELQRDAVSPGAPTRIEHKLSQADHPSRGPTNAPVIIHVFSDFECPYCRLAEQNLAQLSQEYPGKIVVVWHDFPLPFHERARPLAKAARAAYELGGDAAFWKVHDAIFALEEQEPRLADESLRQTLSSGPLSWERLQTEAQKPEFDAAISADQELAKQLGIAGTPALIIGDYLVTGARPTDYLKRIVELTLHPTPAATNSATPSSEKK
jgi:protein-disulfide isomerase